MLLVDLLVKFDMAGRNGGLKNDPELSNRVEDHMGKGKKLDHLFDRAKELGFTGMFYQLRVTSDLKHSIVFCLCLPFVRVCRSSHLYIITMCQGVS